MASSNHQDQLRTCPLPAFSDGATSTHPEISLTPPGTAAVSPDKGSTSKPYELAHADTWASWLRRTASILIDVYLAHPNKCPVPLPNGARTFASQAACAELPSGYILVTQRRGKVVGYGKGSDTYLYGHPSGAKYRSVPEFQPHLEWLVISETHDCAECLCKPCRAWAKRISGGGTPTPRRRKRTTSEGSLIQTPASSPRPSQQFLDGGEVPIFVDSDGSPRLPPASQSPRRPKSKLSGLTDPSPVLSKASPPSTRTPASSSGTPGPSNSRTGTSVAVDRPPAGTWSTPASTMLANGTSMVGNRSSPAVAGVAPTSTSRKESPAVNNRSLPAVPDITPTAKLERGSPAVANLLPTATNTPSTKTMSMGDLLSKERATSGITSSTTPHRIPAKSSPAVSSLNGTPATVNGMPAILTPHIGNTSMAQLLSQARANPSQTPPMGTPKPPTPRYILPNPPATLPAKRPATQLQTASVAPSAKRPRPNPSALSQFQRAPKAPAAANVPNSTMSQPVPKAVSAVPASQTVAPLQSLQQETDFQTEPIYREGDLVWVQVCLEIASSQPLIPIPTPKDPKNVLDVRELIGGMTYWPAVIRSIHLKTTPNRAQTFQNAWVPPLFVRKGSNPTIKTQFSPVHRYRGIGEIEGWNDIGYVIRLVDVPVEFATLEPLLRPFAGFILPREMRLETSSLKVLANAGADPILYQYLSVVNKAYHYSRGILVMSSKAPRLLDTSSVTGSEPTRSGPPKFTWDCVQLGAEHIRVGDIVRGNVRNEFSDLLGPNPSNVANPGVTMLQVSQISWTRDEPVRFVCKRVQFISATMPRDERDPTLCRRKGYLYVIREMKNSPKMATIATLAAEEIVGRFYPSLTGIDGWAGPRTAVPVRNKPMSLVD